MDIRAAVLTEIEDFLAATGMAPTTFGKDAVNDGHFVARLRGGSNITIGTIDRARSFMEGRRAAESATGGAVA